MRWEFTKFEIRQFSINSFKTLSKSSKGATGFRKIQLKLLNEDYLACKTKLDKIDDKKVEGLRIRSKCDWYKKEQKSTKFF